MVVLPMCRGLDITYGFVLSARMGYCSNISCVRITMPIKCTCDLTAIACGRWSLVIDLLK